MLVHAKNSATKIAVIGSGSIGIGFGIVFARAGMQVALHDADPVRCQEARMEIAARLTLLAKYALIGEPIDDLLDRISFHKDLESAASNAALVIECATEDVPIKHDIFTKIDAIVPADSILCSASSALPISSFTSELKGRARCLISHPANPPYLMPVIELVPAQYTARAVIERCRELFVDAGMKPILVRREVEGFVFNRLQGALLREAYCLIRDGVVSVHEIDTIVREGLGLRWSVVGPFEAVDLNTRGGVESHAKKMGPAYQRMALQRKRIEPWTTDLIADVTEQRRRILPLSDWESRVTWRDEQLMKLLKLRTSDPES